ncbi:amino acid transporter [Microbacterium mangrovi]|uniref:Amino acid transporter n=1 Tax=Microbacterium mangrovi TaxID=1348253 RepID=A0A0B2ABD9_9MICO|nr:LysE/ArgO family amino acid transporter [Microbacterium mangrovi]KHK98941.1 amino acid transporter [Microbacterium mangrovi]
MLTAALAGLGLGLSLIVAIGAQNLFVLRQGLRREHVLAVALVCTLSDAALILLGVSGVGLALQTVPWLLTVARWAGAVFLLGYAVLAARRAWRPSGEALAVADDVEQAGGRADTGSRPGATAVASRTGLAAALTTCLALTWLNPHVYLDTVFLLGSIASTHGADRGWFALGAVCASALWFFALAYGARFLGRWLSTPRAWRILDGIIAIVMTVIAVNLVVGA